MKAFIGRSFKEEDDALIAKIAEFLTSQGIDCGDAKSAKIRKVEDKVTELISECDIFVGVFTRYEPLCKEKNNKWFCMPKNVKTEYATSNWVIQESGYALGRDKKLILLKEEGVSEPPKLQGNLEYISFVRDNLQETFLKISQMISDMKVKNSGGITDGFAGKSERPTEIEIEPQKKETNKGTDDKEDKIRKEIFSAITKDKDYTKAQTILQEKGEIFDEEERPSWQAYILKESHSLGDTSAFDKLHKFVHKTIAILL